MRTLFLAIWCALPVAAQRIDLADGWTLQSSSGGREYPTRVPSTVVGALVANQVFPNPYFGMNLRSYPGMGYDIGRMFANLPTPADSPFAVPWRYRTDFRLAATAKGKRVWLNFESINYRANIRLNRKFVASREETPGMYRTFEFDVTDKVSAGANQLEVEVFPPKPNDLTITFVDWNPMPPDKDMGLVGDVYVQLSGPVAVRNPQVRTTVSASHDRAVLSASADLRNGSDAPVEGTLKAELGGRVVSKKVTVAAHASERVDLAAVTVANPKLVAVPVRSAESPAREFHLRNGRERVGPSGRRVRHPGGNQRTGRAEAALVSNQRTANPDPRRRVDPGHAAAARPRSRGRRAALCPRHEFKHRAPRG
jgi:exo-1,4-beta-D-glucosaminidase